MWSQVCDIQEHCTPKALLTKLYLLFVFSQWSTQETESYLGTIRNLILQCKSGGGDFYNPLMNLIYVKHLDPSHYQKVMDRCDVGSIDWPSKYLDTIDI